VAPAGVVAGVEVVVDPVADTVGFGRYGVQAGAAVFADVAALARCSNALVRLIAAWRSLGFCISTLEVIGSPSPAVNKFI
jgi:hypothetical protein